MSTLKTTNTTLSSSDFHLILSYMAITTGTASTISSVPCSIDLSRSEPLPQHQDKVDLTAPQDRVDSLSTQETTDILAYEEFTIFPSLPPLYKGHPEVHMRAGVTRAAYLAESHQPDAEKAFLVADLGEVYRQHHRWVTSLPEIQPFYGS